VTATAPEPAGEIHGTRSHGPEDGGTTPSVGVPGPPGAQLTVKADAVRWLSPRELLRTGLVVLQGTIFAKYADKRETMGSVPGHAYDLTSAVGDGDGLWIDYVADIGDGFEATYTVACSITGAGDVVAPPGTSLPLDGCSCTPADGRDRLLVLGGDEVYPVASVGNYAVRTTRVYDVAWTAAPGTDRAYAVAVPGNHDWYDGLVAFRRNFCESWITAPGSPQYRIKPREPAYLDKFASWNVFQDRSYFAVQLPHGWWLWGIDIQLDAPIDAAQLDYFRRARDLLTEHDRVILCTGRPSWIDPAGIDDEYTLSDRQNLAWFVSRFFSSPEALGKVRLLLSGDKHHYARYSPALPAAEDDLFRPYLVTCGGGGAYLSSTHHLPRGENFAPFHFDEQDTLSLTQTPYRAEEGHLYPSAATSQGLRKGFWRIPFRNDNLPLFVTGIHAVLLWMLAIGEGRSGWPHLGRLHWNVVRGHTLDTLAAFVPLVVVTGLLGYLLVLYARSGAKPATALARLCGALHTLAHLAAVYVLSGWLGPVVRALWDDDPSWSAVSWDALTCLVVIVALVVWGFLGALVFATYLWICDALPAPLHENELFAGMRIEDFKSHLRIHVTPDALHVRVIGIDGVPRRGDWGDSDASSAAVTHPVPASPVASREVDAFVVTRDP
jgi:hypothetical protein